jgi:hypothetical protein
VNECAEQSLILPELENLQENDPAALARLDEAGLPAGAGEMFDAYKARLLNRQTVHARFEAELAERGELTVFESIKVRSSDRIPDEIIAEAAEITDRLYAFAVKSFPGFFLSKDVGLLWGGCLIGDTETPLSLFLIRSAFRTKKRFLIYDRRELLAHELCHSARQELHDFALEEYFAYQTSPSRLRRYIGNCFIRQRDALFFTIPALLVLAAQIVQIALWPGLPIWPFWLAAAVFPGWLLLRNHLSRRQIAVARKNLERFGVSRPPAVLFRTTSAEREAIAALKSPAEFTAFVAEKAKSEIRWQVIRYRFIQQKEIGDETRTTY